MPIGYGDWRKICFYTLRHCLQRFEFSILSLKAESLNPNDLNIRLRLSSSTPTTSLIEVQDSSLDLTPIILGRSNKPGVLLPLMSVV